MALNERTIQLLRKNVIKAKLKKKKKKAHLEMMF